MVQQAVVRCALYARVSSDKQEQEATIQSQLEALRRHAGCGWNGNPAAEANFPSDTARRAWSSCPGRAWRFR